MRNVSMRSRLYQAVTRFITIPTVMLLAACLTLVATTSSHAQSFPNQVYKDVYDNTPVTPQCSNRSFENGFSDWQTFRAKRTPSGGLPYENFVQSSTPLLTTACSGAPGSCVNLEASGTDANIPAAAHPKTQHGGMSLRLGGTQFTGTQSNKNIIEGAAKRFIVTAENAIYKFRYSSVMHKKHDSTSKFTGEEPYFQAVAIDPTTGAVIDSFVQPASGYNPNMLVSTDKPGVVYSLWGCSKLDLSSHVGKEVVVYLVNSDCAHGGHVSYTYIDDTCTDCDKPEDAGITIEKVENLKTCEPNKKAKVTGTLAIPPLPVATNISVKLDIVQGNSTIGTLTNGTITGNSYSFDIAQSDLKGLGCYDLVATLEYDVTTPAGNVVHVEKKTALEGFKKGADNDLCLEDCKPKPPVQNACFSGDTKVKCGKKPGTFVAVFEPKGAGGEVPDYVDVESLTTGVTLTSSTGTYPVRNGKVRVTMIGANAGDTIKLSVNGSTLDPTSDTGMSMCCNGEMEITIPKDIQCDGKKIDLAIVKTGTTTPDPTQPFYAFELEVTNWGADINNGGNILVTDTVPAGMVFASAGGTDWQCDTLPANGGDEVKCAYTGNSFVVSGQILPKIKINATSTGHEPFPPVKNCAQVQPVPGAGLIDTKHSNDESCVTVSKPDKDVKVSIVKTCDKPVIDAVTIDNAAVDCVIKVTATGPVSTPITVVETLNMPGAGLSNVSTLPGSVGWGCGPTTNQGPVSCTLPANTLTGPSYSAEIGATIQMDANPHLRPGKNCAVLEMGGNQIEETCAYVEVPEFGANQPTPKPAVTPVVGPVCDPATTVKRGKSCACLFSRMVQKSKTSCACVKGREFVKGKGCLRPKPQCRKGAKYNKERRRCEPICAKGQKYSSKRNKCFTPRPQCKAGTKYNAKRKKCLSICRAGFTYSKRRKACVSICKRGSVYSRKRNKCITLKPKCRAGFAYSQKRKACVSVCKPGSRYDRRRKRCVSVGGGINIKICPKGTKFDIRKRRCVGKERPPPRPRHYNEADCEAAAVSPRECKAWLKQKNG